MEPLFSASVSEMEGNSSIAEIQLLADQELMSLWEQTQVAVSAIEARGGSAATARRYERAILLEMQKRTISRPAGTLFGLTEEQNKDLPEAERMPRIMVVR